MSRASQKITRLPPRAGPPPDAWIGRPAPRPEAGPGGGAEVEADVHAVGAEGALQQRDAPAQPLTQRRVGGGIAGAGRRFSGPYYVTSVTHTLTAEHYGTAFTVRRNAT